MSDKCSDKSTEAMLKVCTAEISSKMFWPEGPKIFADQKICAGNLILKLKSQLAPRILSKVEPCESVHDQSYETLAQSESWQV